MILVGVWSLLPPPIWNSENEHGWQVFHCASAAAIFIGWYVVSMHAELAADDHGEQDAGTSTTTSEPGRRAERPRGERPGAGARPTTASMTARRR